MHKVVDSKYAWLLSGQIKIRATFGSKRAGIHFPFMEQMHYFYVS